MDEQGLREVLSRNIKLYRGIKRLSQIDLAAALDISPNFLSDIERCKAWISPQTLVKLAAALEIEPYELLKDDILKPKTAQYVTKSEKSVIERFADDTLAEISKAVAVVRRGYLPKDKA